LGRNRSQVHFDDDDGGSGDNDAAAGDDVLVFRVAIPYVALQKTIR
jgi:hypothetical protein